jgi:hypothetical protein
MPWSSRPLLLTMERDTRSPRKYRYHASFSSWNCGDRSPCQADAQAAIVVRSLKRSIRATSFTYYNARFTIIPCVLTRKEIQRRNIPTVSHLLHCSLSCIHITSHNQLHIPHTRNNSIIAWKKNPKYPNAASFHPPTSTHPP